MKKSTLTVAAVFMTGAFVDLQSPCWAKDKVTPANAFPQHTLKNDAVKLTIYLPDAEKGYYRGTRFDWSGLIEQAEYKGHTFFGPWKTTHDPRNHDDADGPVEEFGMFAPLGYGEAKVGESFIKIGVGRLEKPKEEKYQVHGAYKIVEPGTWKITYEADWIQFEQDLKDDSGRGYHYVKRIQLAKKSDGFAIEHVLKNNGKGALETDHYCHNFIRIDDQPIGKDYVMEFAFEPAAKKPLKDEAVLKGRRLLFREDLKPDQALFVELQGSKERAEENAVTVKSNKSGAGIRIKGDAPLDHFNVFAVKLAVCPEPFIKIKLMPGKEMKWTTRYTFFDAKDN